MTDMLAFTAELVDIPSVSHDEDAIATHVEGLLRGVPWLTVERVGDNVIARTDLGRSMRICLAGHLDTVPPNRNDRARIEGDTLWGLGAADMKGGVAVFLELARTIAEPAVDVTYVFYAGEEVEAEHNGLGHLFRDCPELLAADAAILGEPTDGTVEAGCQGSLRVDVVLHGRRAHTARAWMGVNAIHRLAPLLALVAEYQPRRPVLDGCEFHEAVQAVRLDAGVAGNVVPDRALVTLNHRFAPDRSVEEAESWLRSFVAPALDDTDGVSLVDAAPGAPPALDHPLLGALVERRALTVRAKLGWTDVAQFAAHRIPAVNFGPGDPELAHTRDERVERSSVEGCYAALRDLLEGELLEGGAT